MKIRWMPLAQQDLAAAYAYIRQDNANAALRVVERIFRCIEMLSRYPSAGRIGRVPTTRELVIGRTPFIVVYRTLPKEIQILAIMHAARRWPESFPESE